jgi:amidase
MDLELARLDATDQAALCARGEVTPRELWEECHRRIAALNPLLRAVVTLAADAPTASAEGPFQGVPFLAKDSMPWPGLRWGWGSHLFARTVSQQQTPYGRRLARAGLVCAGKAAMSEFGLLTSTETLAEGVTHNPWSLAHSSMGSSGGSAAAVAAGLVPVAHANDGGGSIRLPASACGVFGFKPSRGATESAFLTRSDFGDMTSDHCLSRSVRDSARWLEVTRNEASLGGRNTVSGPDVRRLRIGHWTRTLHGREAHQEVRAAHEDTCALLEALGHVVEPAPSPDLDGERLGRALLLVAGAAVASIVDTIDRTRAVPVQVDELEPTTWALVEAAQSGGEAALMEARALFAQAVRAYEEATHAFDVVLTPTLATPVPLLGHTSPLLGREALLERTGRVVGYTPIQNLAGCPAMSVPLHFPDAGVPIGAHFAAAPGSDAALLALAFELEQARPWSARWPPYSIPRIAEARAGRP